MVPTFLYNIYAAAGRTGDMLVFKNQSPHILKNNGSVGSVLTSNGLGAFPTWEPSSPDFITSISDTATIDLDVTANVLTANFINSAGYITASSASNLTNKTGNISQWTNDSGYLTSLSGAVTSVSGTSNRITSTGGSTPVIDIAATYVGQTSLTTLGTISTGTWNATSITVPFGGTGNTTFTAYSPIFAGTTATGAFQSSTLGASGTVLTSTGTSSLPTWQSIPSASVTWNAITNPTGTQTLTFDDGEINTWTINSDTETFWTKTSNSLTTGITELITTSSITTGKLLSLVSTSTAANAFSLLNIASSGANANSTRTAIGATISVTNTGTTSTNIGLSLSSSGATNNYALVVPSTGGSVGIGTTLPLTVLHVESTATNTYTYPSIPTNQMLIKTMNNSAADNQYAGFSFTATGNNSVNNGIAGVGCVQPTVGSTTGELILFTRNSAGTSSEKVRVTGDGFLGIGTATPYTAGGVELSRSSTNTTVTNFDGSFFVVRNSSSTNNNMSGLVFSNSAATGFFTSAIMGVHETQTTTPTGHLEFLTKNAGTISTKMVILANGNVGIGQSTPTAVIHLKAGTATASTAPLKFSSGTNLTTPESGVHEYDGNNHSVTCGTIRGTLPRVLFTQTATKTVTNTVTETSIIGTGVASGGGLTLPASSLIAGRTIRVRVGGVYTTPALTTPSLIIKVKYGSTVIATVTTTGLLSGATNLEFDGEVNITCRTTGATGTVMVHGDIEYATGLGGTIAVDPLNNAGATTTIDTTASSLIDITVQWDTATSTRSVSSTVTTVEVLN